MQNVTLGLGTLPLFSTKPKCYDVHRYIIASEDEILPPRQFRLKIFNGQNSKFKLLNYELLPTSLS
jgi:hypothetical protein